MGKSEWEYLLLYRKDAAFKRGTATVYKVHGMVLLPDRWQTPEGLVFSPGCISWEDNVYTREEWEQMQGEGAVFLPAADYDWDKNPPHPGESGLYWSATPKGDKEAYYVYFYDGRVYASVVNQRCFRLSVRLVRDGLRDGGYEESWQGFLSRRCNVKYWTAQVLEWKIRNLKKKLFYVKIKLYIC